MEVLQAQAEVENGDRPAVLFHYTDASGLLGIVKDQELWATDVQFLNDGEELIYAARTIAVHARDRAEQIHPSAQPVLDDRVNSQAERLRSIAESAEGFAGGRHAAVYVTCFCTNPDLLSQWRGYGRAGGFALGFDSDALAFGADTATGHRLEPVKYDLSALNSLIGEVDRLGPTGTQPGVSGWLWAQQYVLPWLPRVKNPAFLEEHEWRVIFIDALDDLPSVVRYRAGGALGVIPYVGVKLSRSALRRVVVGPGPHPEVRQAGVEKLLRTNDYRDVEVASSAIAASYRSS